MPLSPARLLRRFSLSHAILGAILAATAPAYSIASAQNFTVIDNFDDGNDTGWSRFVQGWLNTDEGAWSIVTGRYNMRSTLNVPSGESGTVLSVLDASNASTYRNGTWKTKVRINNLICSASIFTRAAFDSQGLPFCYALDIHASNSFTRSVELYRLDGNSDTLLGSISRLNLNIAGNTDYWVEFRTEGSTITAKVWADGAAEPSTPQISVTDSTYSTGRFVLTGYKSDNLGNASINVSYDDVQFKAVAAPPPPPPPPPVVGDFNGDRAIDIIWRNKSTGFNVIWLCDQTPADGQFVQSSASITTVQGSQWTIVGRADFNADGKTDILWRNTTTGDNTVWFMDGTNFVSAGSIFSVADRNWVIAGIADFNSDSRPDLLWRNVKTGDNTVWLLNGTAVANAISIPSVTDRAWHPVAAGDLTGDGISDILWRNDRTGAISVWQMNNTTYVAARSLTAGVSDVNWQVADLADFTGDGNLDIVWRNTLTGANVLWEMNDLTFVSSSNLPTIADQNWSVAGMADRPLIKPDDFDGNSFADVVWRNTATGDNSIWLLTAPNALGGASTLPRVTGAWRIQAVGDINRDNRPDIIWRDASTGNNIAWIMNATNVVGTINLPNVPAPWQIVGLADANADGNNDLYWRNATTGENIAWLLDGTPSDSTIVAGTLSLPSVVGDTWSLQGIARIDSDAFPDLVWRNTSTGNAVSGINVVWFMNNNQIGRSVDMPAITDQNWQIGKVSDMNDDGTPDLLWRNTSTGDNSIWLLDTADSDLYTGFLAFPRVADPNWKIED